MILVEDALGATDLPRGVVATIGNYDGVHRGQQAVLSKVVERAEALDATSCVITFEPHPLKVLRPERPLHRLMTTKQRHAALAATGVEALLEVAFTPAFARTAAQAFVEDFLVGQLALRELYVGSGFSFGYRRQGNLELLHAMGREHAFRAQAVAEVECRGQAVSSTRIRRCLHEGRTDDARQLLGRPYAIVGRVVHGQRMGRRLGWPTINLEVENELIPEDGVYACRVNLESFSGGFDAVTNIGSRPTLYESYRQVVESHLLDFDADVYGERVELEFYKRLRGERVFSSLVDLSAQIGRDVESARSYFANVPVSQDSVPA